jgi:hypothetical protein
MSVQDEAQATGPARRPAYYFDLRRDLRRTGCAPCLGEARSAWRYLDGLLWEGVTDAVIRLSLRGAHGFCREHALLAVVVASRESGQLGMAIIFEDLLRHVEGESEASRSEKRGRRRARSQNPLAPHAACHVCKASSSTAVNYLKLLSEADPGSEIGAAARGDGPKLCVPHLMLGMRLAATAAAESRLVDVFVHGVKQLRGDLSEFIRKRDYRFVDETMTPGEANAWVRAVHAMVGTPPQRPPDLRQERDPL